VGVILSGSEESANLGKLCGEHSALFPLIGGFCTGVQNDTFSFFLSQLFPTFLHFSNFPPLSPPLKKIQLITIVIALIGLIGFVTVRKLSENFSFGYRSDLDFQKYNVRGLPKQLFFAGEEVPLADYHTRRSLGRELEIQTYYNPNMAQMLQRVNYWLPRISPVLEKYHIPDDFKYLAVAESNLINLTSPAGAGGYWQLLPETARFYGLEVNEEVDERCHPLKSTEAACKYLGYAKDYFRDWASVAASYNAGIGYLTYAKNSQREKSIYKMRLNPQTAGYLYRVLAFKQLIEHQQAYGYSLPEDPFWNRPVQEIKITRSIPNLTAFAARYKLSYRTLQACNPWLKANSLTVKRKGKSYKLLIPAG
jgi:membrane-bound lytic murein transglycosylase D